MQHTYQKSFIQHFLKTDFINLPPYTMYLKLMINGVTSKAFSAKSLKPELKQYTYKGQIITCSQQQYGKRFIAADFVFEDDRRNKMQGTLFN